MVLISSLLAWDKTPKNLEEIINPADLEEERRAKAAAEAAAAKAAQDAEERENSDVGDLADAGDDKKEENKEGEPGEPGDGEEKNSQDGREEGEVEMIENEKDYNDLEEVKEEEKPKKRRKFLHHPFTESDFVKRAASEEYAKIKEIEDMVLSYKKEGVKTYVISAGVLYGSGEAIFNNHFERAWKQRPEKLPIIGDGKNSVPTIHVKDLARMVKRVLENPPEQ